MVAKRSWGPLSLSRLPAGCIDGTANGCLRSNFSAHLTAAIRYNLDMRFQFRLRTLLTVVTVAAAVCAWIGHEAHVVQERKVMWEWIEKRGGVCNAVPSSPSRPTGEPSFIRRWLGDRTVGEILFNAPVAADDEKRIKIIFPGVVVAYVVW
jgi:hypothetical protein